MTIHIVASGETGSKWAGEGPSIGCNDAGKWGHNLDYLVLLNLPSQFQSSRFEVIKETKPRKVLTNTPGAWGKYFDHVHQIPLLKWSDTTKLKSNVTYHSNTSPFVAISLAHQWGFKKIVLWGVDFITHHRYGKEGTGHVREMLKYMSFIKALNSAGTQVYLGSLGTAFDRHLQVWNKEKVAI